jgi:hypothetical protein
MLSHLGYNIIKKQGKTCKMKGDNKMESKELRNKLALDVNYKGELTRIMAFREKQDYEVGQIVKLGQSWTSGDGDYDPDANFGKKVYAFYCKYGEGHKINYDELTEDEIYTLGCEDCEGENEVLVSSEQEFRILSTSTDEDFREMGFYMIDVEMIKEA